MNFRHWRVQFWYSVCMICFSFMLLAVFTVGYVGRAIKHNNKPVCDVILVITNPRPQPPVDPHPSASPDAEFERKLQRYRLDTAQYNREAAEKLQALSRQYKCYKERS
jgi:hypothetical protein